MSQEEPPSFLGQEMAKDAANKPVTNEDLESVSALANKQVELEQEVAALEDKLKEKQKELRRVAEHDIPTKMDEIGLQEFTLSDGRRITVKEDVKASIPQHRKDEAAGWLFEHGLGSLVKENVAIGFEAGQDDLVQDLQAKLQDLGYRPKVAKEMNTNSVKAALKELRANGVDVPKDLFGLYDLRQAKIIAPKE